MQLSDVKPVVVSGEVVSDDAAPSVSPDLQSLLESADEKGLAALLAQNGVRTAADFRLLTNEDFAAMGISLGARNRLRSAMSGRRTAEERRKKSELAVDAAALDKLKLNLKLHHGADSSAPTVASTPTVAPSPVQMVRGEWPIKMSVREAVSAHDSQFSSSVNASCSGCCKYAGCYVWRNPGVEGETPSFNGCCMGASLLLNGHCFGESACRSRNCNCICVPLSVLLFPPFVCIPLPCCCFLCTNCYKSDVNAWSCVGENEERRSYSTLHALFLLDAKTGTLGYANRFCNEDGCCADADLAYGKICCYCQRLL